MFRLFPLVIILQGFCIWHAYTNQADQKWYWIILFFPFVGSLIYVYDQFYNRRNIENISEGFKGVLIENYKIKKLEQQVKFSPTFTNKVELADEHLVVGNYDRAHELYHSCYSGPHTNDTHLNMSLLKVNYLLGNYSEVLQYREKVKDSQEFRTSEEKSAYAWALYQLGQSQESERVFESMDNNYCNYSQRLEYAKFLEQTQGKESAKQKLNEILDEVNAMDSYERKVNSHAIRSIKTYSRNL